MQDQHISSIKLAGATVEAVGPSPSKASRTAITGDDGRYIIPNLEPGNYDIYFSRAGYEDDHALITISPGKTYTLNVGLSPMAFVTVAWTYTGKVGPGTDMTDYAYRVDLKPVGG
ncbi:unnamed protein product, partial [marine sediment metagenome]